jgi:peptidoglycan/xylan/chitin deacetylase (PgdA/CDA1 family)
VLRAWAGDPAEGRPSEVDRPMTQDELRSFASLPGVSVGAHTRSHRSLRKADRETQDAEIAGSRDDLTEWLGAEPTGFSYPFGIPGADFDDGVVERVRAAGFSLAVTTADGVMRGADRFRLPRRSVPDIGGDEFEEWLGRPVSASAH